jgi:hypothetical protein
LLRLDGEREKAQTLTETVRLRLATIREQGGQAAGLEYCAAGVLTQQEHADQALAALARAVASGWRAADWMQQDPVFAPLRGSPQFATLLAEQRRDVASERAPLEAAARPPL